MIITKYEANAVPGPNQVVFINEHGVRLVGESNSLYALRRFVNRLKRSKKCTLISYPISIM